MTPDLIEVTQADRDAAADYYEGDSDNPLRVATSNFIRGGEHDDDPLVQAFARHRLNTLSALEAEGWVVTKGWQPIETAPKDGTMLLVYYESHGATFQAVAHFNEDTSAWIISFALLAIKPTHWQHLPEPPLSARPESSR